MDFIVEKKSLDSAMKQLLHGRKENPADLVEIIAEGSTVTLAATGTEAPVSVPAVIPHSFSFTSTMSLDLAASERSTASDLVLTQ